MMMKKYQNMDLIARNIRKTIEDPRTIVDSAKRDPALAACLNESGSCTVTNSTIAKRFKVYLPFGKRGPVTKAPIAGTGYYKIKDGSQCIDFKKERKNNKWHLCNELQADAYFWATCPIGTGNKSLNS